MFDHVDEWLIDFIVSDSTTIVRWEHFNRNIFTFYFHTLYFLLTLFSMEIFRFFVIGRKISFSTQSDLQQSAVVVKVVVQLRNILGKRYQDMIQELIFNIENLKTLPVSTATYLTMPWKFSEIWSKKENTECGALDETDNFQSIMHNGL